MSFSSPCIDQASVAKPTNHFHLSQSRRNNRETGTKVLLGRRSKKLLIDNLVSGNDHGTRV